MTRVVTAVIAFACSIGIALASGKAVLPEQWRVQGEGEMRWFGLSLYQARLWTPPQQPLKPWQPISPQRAAAVQADFALELRYSRDIPGQRLVSASIDELKRLGWTDPARLSRWQSDLAKVFPDVKEGEVIVGRHHAGGSAEFFHQGQSTGRLDDGELATAFFSIWLDPRTSEPGLRTLLFGAS